MKSRKDFLFRTTNLVRRCALNRRMPHPRWSQLTERGIDTGDRVKTQSFNGAVSSVVELYPPLKWAEARTQRAKIVRGICRFVA